jgi:CheY-like chemotaxis protein
MLRTRLTLADVMSLEFELSDHDRTVASGEIEKAASLRGKKSDSAALMTRVRKARIGVALWVDDHPGNNVYEIAALRSVGIFVTQVIESSTALTLLEEDSAYDIVISDLVRQGDVNAGIEFIKTVKGSTRARSIIVYTGNAESRRAEVLAAGVDYVLDDPSELVGTMTLLLKAPARS